ncbi:hypothetical protein EYE40_00545 [Glaciihabitans arcticus]|uniref:Uncharacterized protein n=1 Tax=Glaciihabitans arcticus TaxID=2668039 RepID=A0A4Q9GMT1_9MICO|nr:hypothetical protein [Glaciihabitans arcticus]TBN56006.1 hypothetical protein EYE40_00545 [Glaciihabitans arcticus]
MAIRGETARVVVTVKTSPQPSAKYGDTVCVAGIRIDGGRSEWIRLYPIPFRYFGAERKFAKYDIIELTVRRRHEDGRNESYSPEWDSIETIEHLHTWADRVPYLRDVDQTSTCELQSGTAGNPNGPSLGLVPVLDVSKMEFEDHPGWTVAEQSKISNALSQVDLFGNGSVPPRLESPRFKVRYRYRCSDPRCTGHQGQILDWEMTELQRHLKSDSDATAKRKITQKYLEMMFASKRHTSFYMGNFENARRREKFSVLGVYYPERSTASTLSLF